VLKLNVVKAGSHTGPILGSAKKNDIAKLTKDAVLIICTSTNDMEQNNSVTA
jgi:hypothetical protein